MLVKSSMKIEPGSQITRDTGRIFAVIGSTIWAFFFVRNNSGLILGK